jgi:GH24 family phage-related lysozyme (muramidase)
MNTLGAFTREREGSSLTAYPDAGGQSIGIGHHIRPGESFGTLTPDQQEALFQKDYGAAQAMVLKQLSGVKMNEKIMTGLTDLAYNRGSVPEDMVKSIKAGNWDQALSQLEKRTSDKSGVAFNPELYKRRLLEEGQIRQGLAEQGTTTVSQQTTINVNGAGDPNAVGQKVASLQSKVNQDTMRNMAPRTN